MPIIPYRYMSMARLAISYDYFHRFDDANKLREEALRAEQSQARTRPSRHIA